jgi:hypothetical protein
MIALEVCIHNSNDGLFLIRFFFVNYNVREDIIFTFPSVLLRMRTHVRRLPLRRLAMLLTTE